MFSPETFEGDGTEENYPCGDREDGWDSVVEWSVTGWRGDLENVLGSDFVGGWEY